MSNTCTDNPIAIIGAMTPEVARLKAALSDVQTIEIGGTTIYRGKLADKAVLVMQCGIGKVNAAIGTTLLIERFKARAVINTGSAGGLGQGLSLGDVVIGKQVLHHDVDITAFGYAKGQMAEMPAYYQSDDTLSQVAQQAIQHLSNTKVHQGLIVSGDQFIHDSAAVMRIRTDFPSVQAVEMEAAAIAQTCYRFAVPCVIIRAISDLADEKASVSFEEFIDTASKHSAQMVEEIIRQYPAS